MKPYYLYVPPGLEKQVRAWYYIEGCLVLLAKHHPISLTDLWDEFNNDRKQSDISALDYISVFENKINNRYKV